jgi:putative membrane protein
MSDLKTQRIFDQTFNTTPESSSVENTELAPASQFDNDTAFIVEPNEPDKVEQQLTQVIRPSHKRRWVGGTLLTGFGGLLAWQLGDSVYSAYMTHDWLTLGWTGFLAILSTLGLARLGKEFFILRKLRRHFSMQEQAEQLIKGNSVGYAKAFCLDLAKNSEATIDNKALNQWQNQLHGAHSDTEVFDLYDNFVMKQQDEQAIKAIAKYSSESAALVAISPMASADMLLVAWRSLKMIDELSDIYGVSLGYWARIRVLKSVLKNMAFAGISEFAIDTGMDMMSTSLASKLSARAGQGIGVGILNARLGVQALTLLRPLPWFPDRQVRIGHVRKQVIAQVKRVLINSDA